MKEINVFANWDYVWVDMTPEERIEIRKYVHSINENLTDREIIDSVETFYNENANNGYVLGIAIPHINMNKKPLCTIENFKFAICN